MTEDQARTVHSGSIVRVFDHGRDRLAYVTRVSLGGIAGPHFRLSPIDNDPTPIEGRTSYQILGYAGMKVVRDPVRGLVAH